MRRKALVGLLGLGLFAALTAKLFVWPPPSPCSGDADRRQQPGLLQAAGHVGDQRSSASLRLPMEPYSPRLPSCGSHFGFRFR
jgi:hypothetical protein